MKLYSSQPELALPSPGTDEGVLLALDQAPPPSSSMLRVAELRAMPNPSLLGDLLGCDQIWAPSSLLNDLETYGLPAHRLRGLDSEDQRQALADQMKPYQDVGVVWRGPFGRNSSLSWVNSMTVKALEEQGWRILLQPVGAVASTLKVPAITQSWPVDMLPASEGPLAIYAPWEYVSVPQTWLDNGPRAANRWLCPSDYCLQSMISSGLGEDWVSVIPIGVDSEAFSPQGPALIERQQKAETVFLFVGGTIYRKGLDILQAAWEEAFSADDPVRLIIKDFGSSSHYAGQNTLSQLQEWAAEPQHAAVQIIDDHLGPEQMPDLYRSADVGVFPYRGEGFCMPALEAMSCGLPIIYPDHGPSIEYCRQGGWRVASSARQLQAPPDIELVAPPIVHEIESSALVEALRAACQPQQRQEKALAARQEALQCSWAKAGQQAALSLSALKEEEANYRLKVSRPQGKQTIVAIDGRQAGQFGQLLKQLPAHDDVTFALHCQPGASTKIEQELISRLGAFQLETDVTIVESEDWTAMALGCDAVLLLGAAAQPNIGLPQLNADALQLWLQANNEHR